jgi:hypothetical protein
MKLYCGKSLYNRFEKRREETIIDNQLLVANLFASSFRNKPVTQYVFSASFG